MSSKNETMQRIRAAWESVPDERLTLGRFLQDACHQYELSMVEASDDMLVQAAECYSRRLNDIAEGQRVD